MNNIFPQSKELFEIISSYNWSLYDATPPEDCKHDYVFKWNELAEKGVSTEFEIGHNYIFAPNPKNGETLKEAYSITKGFGPSLNVENPDEERWIALQVGNSVLPGTRVVLFSRLFFEEKFLVASSPKTFFMMNPDIVVINYAQAIDTFKKYFKVILPEEIGMQTPVPMPHSDMMN